MEINGFSKTLNSEYVELITTPNNNILRIKDSDPDSKKELWVSLDEITFISARNDDEYKYVIRFKNQDSLNITEGTMRLITEALDNR